MKLRFATTAILLASIPAVLSASTEIEKFDRVFDFQPGTRLMVSNENGMVKVRTWDKTAVHVEAVKRARSSKPERAREVLQQVKIEVRADGKTLVVKTVTPENDHDGFFSWLEGKNVDLDVEYTITVPKSLPLDVETVNGKIDVASVQGVLKLTTTNGQIVLEDAGGSLEAETTNGGIHAEMLQVTPGSKMALSTTNGGIELSVPSNIQATLRASTTNGSVQSDLPVLTRGASDNSLEGTINGGGPDIELETTNGSIRIRKSN